MDTTGSQICYMVTNNGKDAYQAGVNKYQTDAFKAGRTLGAGCHVHMLLRHENNNYVVVYNNSCCLKYAAGIKCCIPRCSYFHAEPGSVMDNLPLSSPGPAAKPVDWLVRQGLHTMVETAIHGVTSTLSFTEAQQAMVDRLREEDARASNAVQRSSMARKLNEREHKLYVEKEAKELSEINVDTMNLAELKEYRARTTTYAVKRKRVNRVYNRQHSWSVGAPAGAEITAPIAAVPAATSTAVPADHPLMAETPVYVPPPSRRNSDEEDEIASSYTARTMRPTGTKPRAHTFEFFVQHYAAYSTEKKAAKLINEATKSHAAIKLFEGALQPMANAISEHAKQRREYQLAYLQHHDAPTYSAYLTLSVCGKQLLENEKEWNFFSTTAQWPVQAT